MKGARTVEVRSTPFPVRRTCHESSDCRGPRRQPVRYDLAGKYIAGYGTPFDLSELAGVSPYLNVNDVTEVRITDVVGSIDPLYGTRDSLGNLINDPFPTPFTSSGFDLNGIGVINTEPAAVPEPSAIVTASIAGLMGFGCAWRRHRKEKLAVA